MGITLFFRCLWPQLAESGTTSPSAPGTIATRLLAFSKYEAAAATDIIKHMPLIGTTS